MTNILILRRFRKIRLENYKMSLAHRAMKRSAVIASNSLSIWFICNCHVANCNLQLNDGRKKGENVKIGVSL